MDEISNAPAWKLVLVALIFGGQATFFAVTRSYFRTKFPFGLKIVDRSDNVLEHTCVTISFSFVALVAIMILAFR